ncbi:MAG: sugar phosphate isomerase/epimerase [Acidobacteria bacterium]|nr:sugar phosphate isomerase/epimerase [Acidobacteriota bacterium]MCI0722144.1 sugar phosphate isomerase/epimerase [Acidobacteriota bacterium]
MMVTTTLFILTPDFPKSDKLPMPAGPYDATVETAKRLGYDGIELIPADPDVVDAAELIEALHKHQTTISAINSGGILYALDTSLVNADPQKEKLAFRKLQTVIRLAARLGCFTQVGVARGFAVVGKPIHWFRDRLAGVLREACDCAAEQGVDVVLEYTNRFEINTVNNLDEALCVIDKIARPNVGLLLDTGHSYLEDPDVYEAIVRARDYLKHVHLHDSDRGPAGSSQGVLDFDRIIRILSEINYSGALSDGLLTLSLPEEQVKRSTDFLRATALKYGLRSGGAVTNSSIEQQNVGA